MARLFLPDEPSIPLELLSSDLQDRRALNLCYAGPALVPQNVRYGPKSSGRGNVDLEGRRAPRTGARRDLDPEALERPQGAAVATARAPRVVARDA